MSTQPPPAFPADLENRLIRLYWLMRTGMAVIWIWTAITSWFIYPHAESLDWLRRLGLTQQSYFFFASACAVDLLMGVASVVLASQKLWKLQFAIVVFYSLAIAIRLPEFLIHPFGPITKNVAVLACLAYLQLIEKTLKPSARN